MPSAMDVFYRCVEMLSFIKYSLVMPQQYTSHHVSLNNTVVVSLTYLSTEVFTGWGMFWNDFVFRQAALRFYG